MTKKEWLKDKVVIYEKIYEGYAGSPSPWGWLYKTEYDSFLNEWGVTPSQWRPIPVEFNITSLDTKKYHN